MLRHKLYGNLLQKTSETNIPSNEIILSHVMQNLLMS